MAAATASRDPLHKDSDMVAYPVATGVKIYRGTMVNINAAGFAIPARSGTSTDVFGGVADETVDNTAGADGAKTVRLMKSGTFVFAKASAVAADVGDAFYAADDQTLTATTTNNQLVGYGVEVVSGATLRIRIDRAVQ